MSNFAGKLWVTRLRHEGAPILSGHVRTFEQCKKCERIYYRDFVPYSLSNPILTLPCGHNVAQRYSDCVRTVGRRDERRLATKDHPQ